jgi:glyoxylase-like metal-dependent hydrolase (beta-lactamase superfamily II)
MTRWLTVSLLLFCSGSLAQAPDFAKAEIKVSKVAGNVYLLRSDTGSNMAASVGEDGVLLVDASYSQMLDKTREALLRITKQPVRYLVNTHYHGDHTGGNVGFPDAVVVAHANALKRLAAGGVGGNFATFRFEYPALPPAALPKLTFEREFTLPFNGEEVRVLHHPQSHTDGDAIVYFPKANVVHMGDQFTVYGFPDIDVAGGASTPGWIAALDDVLRMLPPDVKVIPGHGPLSTMNDVKRFRNMLSETLEAVRAAVLAGKTPEQMKQEKILEPWKKWAGVFSADVYLDMLYNDIVGIQEWPVPPDAGGE